MADETRALFAESAAERLETERIFQEVDAALEAYGRSIDRGLALAAEMRALADSWDAMDGF